MSAEMQLGAPDEWSPDTRLVDLLLEEQQTLSAVDLFSEAHAQLPHDRSHYETLIPSRLPDAAEQFAFRVDLDACTGCKACVTACHSLNGLEDEETWRSVGLVESVPDVAVASVPHQQTVTTACHHCEDPACLAGCPVKAYDKDEITGIVRHLDDQCIGCRYCQLTCPYDVPTYSERLGIVRKCDMCHDRLEVGEAPACVQGCPNQAISIAIVPTSSSSSTPSSISSKDLLKSGQAASLLPVVDGAMPSSQITKPTTRYVSARPQGEPLHPAQLGQVEPSAGHSPLAVMLVLTQMSIGTLLVSSMNAYVFGSTLSAETSHASLVHAIALTLAAVIGFAGLGASVLHIGRPQWAFRAFLGLRTSWMSREIIALGGYAGLMAAACGLAWLDWAVLSGQFDAPIQDVSLIAQTFSNLAGLTGLLGLFCSVQIYAVTGRPLWRFDRTLLRFCGTTILLGMAGFAITPLLASIAAAGASPPALGNPVILSAFAFVAVFSAVKLWTESGLLIHGKAQEGAASRGTREGIALERTRILLSSSLLSINRKRRAICMVAGIALSMLCAGLIVLGAPVALTSGIALLVLGGSIVGELLERSLFFRSEAAPAMPRAN